MAVPEILMQNVRYWTMVMRALDTLVPVATVASHQRIELGEQFFDRPDVYDARWFQLDPAKYDLFLDDTVGTVHLANLSGRFEYAASETPLVTWYGHDPKRHRIQLNSSEGPQQTGLPEGGILWFAWDARGWTLYAHDGKMLVPVFNATEIAAALELGPEACIWMGWNGQKVDLFTVDPRHVPEDLCAAFVTGDYSVGTVHHNAS